MGTPAKLVPGRAKSAPTPCRQVIRTQSELSFIESRISVDDYQACSGDCFKSAEGASYTSMGRSPMDDRPNRIRGPKARSILSGNEQAARQRPSIGPAGASLRIIYGDSELRSE